MATVEQHELTNYLPLETNENNNNSLLSSTQPNSTSSSMPLQPSRWKTKGIKVDLGH